MNEFNDNRQVYSDSIRGTYVIFPLKYDSSLNLTELTIDGVENADFHHMICQIFLQEDVGKKTVLSEDTF